MPAPSLGRQIIHWMHANLAAPDRADGEMFVPTKEQREFIREFYEVDASGRRKKRRGVLSRAKGWGKSPLLAAIAAAEGLGPVVFDHWAAEGEIHTWGKLTHAYHAGEPVGRPWRSSRTPLVQISAVSEDQTRNCWSPLLEMLNDGPAKEAYPGLNPMETFVSLPGGGRIEFVTASARSREGNRPVFCVLDQTETWLPSNGGVKLAATMRRNLGKTGGSSIESPNAYLPGEGSVAEASAAYWQTIEDGKARDDGLFYSHREAPAKTDLTSRYRLLYGLRLAYGCSSSLPCALKDENGERHDHGPGWVDLERIIAEIWDPATDPQDARRYYLNQITHASDSYVSEPEWRSRLVDDHLKPGDVITLGFDGSRGRARGKPDATGLIATRVSDGHQVKLGGWEADEGPGMEEWQPPLVEIDAAWDDAFRLYRVAAAYADPAKDWRSKVDEWEAKYSRKIIPNAAGKRVFVTLNHPFEWWMTGGRSVWIERAVLAYEAAIRNGEMSHNGDQQFTRHVLNARRRFSHQKLTIGKENDSSYKKVDLCVCAILSWQARMDAVALGIGASKRTGRIQRLR